MLLSPGVPTRKPQRHPHRTDRADRADPLADRRPDLDAMRQHDNLPADPEVAGFHSSPSLVACDAIAIAVELARVARVALVQWRLARGLDLVARLVRRRVAVARGEAGQQY